jgi:hypothetical protein
MVNESTYVICLDAGSITSTNHKQLTWLLCEPYLLGYNLVTDQNTSCMLDIICHKIFYVYLYVMSRRSESV